MKCLLGVSFLLICSPLLAVPPPEEEGWRKLDFVCASVETGDQTYPSFYVGEKEDGYWEDVRADGATAFWHSYTQYYLQKEFYGADNLLSTLMKIDRSTGYMTMKNYKTQWRSAHDCKLRAENKF